ncbi:type II toxin-antitoxin system VapC family toxin [Phyllobacterium leguminum]|nr:type II toxin-antitoxin system VapC family toxin [Phyllobacterium leguminum]
MDTNIISALMPGKPPLPPHTAEWMRAHESQMYIPSLAIHEIRRGISKLNRAGGHERAERFLAWLNGIIEIYRDKILVIDFTVALVAGEMEDKAIAEGRNPGLADVLIAATAKTHSLTLLTANIRHFHPLGVTCFNPSEDIS